MAAGGVRGGGSPPGKKEKRKRKRRWVVEVEAPLSDFTCRARFEYLCTPWFLKILSVLRDRCS